MTLSPSAARSRRLADRLAAETRCEVRFDPGSLGLYATDASLYQIPPLGVALPCTVRDVIDAVRIAFEEGVPVLPRGGATSLSGQTIGPALVLDVSKHLNRIGLVDRSTMTVRVEPGVILDQLNAHLKPLGLMFGPDVSTSDRATIGGMIGNNSAGARSLKYGKTVDHVRSLDVVLADGTPATFGPVDDETLTTLRARDDRIGTIHRTTGDLAKTHRDAIAARFPRILRRVSGYNLDELVPGLAVRPPGWVEPEPWSFNLARLIVGSEGTLAFVTSAELRVVPIPRAVGLVVLSFATIPAALDRLQEIIETGPASVEMVDRTILDLAAANSEYARYLTFAAGRPDAVLAAQFHADSAEELVERTTRLEALFHDSAGVLGIRTNLNSSARDDFWKVRKAGLSLLMGMVGDAKPVAFVEDTAVDPQRLPEFYRRFNEIILRHDTVGACYGHADVGCLHIRPVLNTKTREGVSALRSIAAEVSDLVAEFGGAMSGEHGDGLARSGWNSKLFGPEVYAAFEAVKRAFDPENRMNPGKVVAHPDPGADLRLGPDYHAREPEDTIFDFSAQGGFARAVEMCSGVGACRKTDSGTMCPSYMVTRDEEHSTRGRANALRLVLAGQIPQADWDNPTLHDALDLCLQCKACKTECPSNVDMSKLKVEYLHHYYQKKPMPMSARLMGRLHQFYPIGSATAPLTNRLIRSRPFRWAQERLGGIDKRRTLPRFASQDFRSWFAGHHPSAGSGRRGPVILLDDCFTTFNTPEVGIAAVRLLEAAGYAVELAGLACCGRPAISKGLLPLARELAEAAVERLIGPARLGVPILGCEPSCLLTLADEYRDFRLGTAADEVAAGARMVDAFLAQPGRADDLTFTPASTPLLLHGHCQQKALVGVEGTTAALKRIPGVDLTVLDSGCCGMAGSFGYEKGHYEVSVKLARRVLLPACEAKPESVLVAPGFSCRSQVHDLADLEAKHPLEILADRLVSP